MGMDTQTIKDIKNDIDELRITEITDLILYYMNTERLDCYCAVRDSDFKELFDSYIKRKNSEYNKMLIRRYYENLQNSLV